MSTAPAEDRPDIGRAAHVAACLDDVEYIEAPGDQLDTAGPFCGCQDCEVREVLHAAFPVLLAGLADHLLTTGHSAAAHELMRTF